MQLLETYPRLKIFIPLIYLIHEDLIVSGIESDLIKKYLDRQTWLTQDERSAINKITTADFNLNGALVELKKSVREQVIAKDFNADAGLIDLGLAFAKGEKNETWAKIALQHQDILDFLNHESFYHFFPEQRSTHSQKADTVYSFDIDFLQRVLDGDQISLIKEIKGLISSGTFEFKHRNDLTLFRDEIYRACLILANKGYGAISYPKQYGGCHDMAAYFTVMESISYADLSLAIKFGVQFGLFGGSVMALGTKKHHDKFLKDIGTLKLPGCFAMTETGHGSNVRGLETTASYEHSSRSFIIHTPHEQAQKEYIGNAAVHGQLATVFAKLIIDGDDYGVVAVLVPIRDTDGNLLSGIKIEDCGNKMGLNGVDNGKIQFDQVSVPYDYLLDRFVSIDEEGKFKSGISSENRRFFTMLGTLVGGRIGVPRSALSATKTGLATAIKYSNLRRQFGPELNMEIPILNYRMHQRRLIPSLAKTYALHFALRYITNRFTNRKEEEAQEIEAIAAGLKAYTTWHNTATLQECRECTGGKGYLSENRIDDLKNDSDVYTTFEGDNTVLMQLVAKSRLTEFKQFFNHIGFTGYINYFASQAFTSVAQKNPLIVRNTEEQHLLDYDFHINAFRYREQDILTSAAKRLKRLMDTGMDSFDAFNVCQHHLIQAAEAYIERIVLEQFDQSIRQVNDPGSKNILRKLCQLYALHTMEEHNGWYLESEYLAPVKTKAIRKQVNQLCWEIRKEAVPLVDAFGIPDNCLGLIARA